jgi:magnesium chelatase family protein
LVNLAPADLAKEGSHFDLPIAIGLLITLGALPQDAADQALFMGELSLDGRLNPVAGALPAAIHAHASNIHTVYVPAMNAPEAAWAGSEIAVYGPNTLKDLILHLKGERPLTRAEARLTEQTTATALDFADVRGQEQAKRAAELAAAGGHNLLMMGPPGSGKSMIAARIPGILPPMSPQEALEASVVHSVAGLLTGGQLITTRPFRDPHHSASAVALTGGGLKAKPGEMSLAHNGVLFLDELPEFPRTVLETLRQPLETGYIVIARANAHVQYPARFQLIAAMNPSPCGYLGHPTTPCTSSPKQIQNYRARLSGPLLDRIDLHIEVPAVNIKDLSLPKPKEGTAEIAARVLTARNIATQRFARLGINLACNAQATGDVLTAIATPTPEAQSFLTQAAERFNLSARAYHRALRVARTLADMQGDSTIAKPHIAEALAYRYQPYQAENAA